jgi:hypothetical protein
LRLLVMSIIRVARWFENKYSAPEKVFDSQPDNTRRYPGNWKVAESTFIL